MNRKAIATTDTDRWKAIRSGPTYCAPACGARCTYAAYQQAKRRAAALARKLGKGWVPNVWENMGWHYEAVLENPHGRAEVHGHGGHGYSFGKATYTAFVHDMNTATHSDPKEALRLAVEKFVAKITPAYELMRLLTGETQSMEGDGR